MTNIPTTLYHGSYCEVVTPDLQRCAPHKDFGRGFYLTTSPSQAEAFAHISLRKAIATKGIDRDTHHATVSVFHFNNTAFGGLQVMMFPTTDADWLHCIVAHRRPIAMPEVMDRYAGYDIISGKVANDDTNATLTVYMAGLYGEVGSAGADALCISLLKPERLTDQICLRTPRALERLSFIKSYRL